MDLRFRYKTKFYWIIYKVQLTSLEIGLDHFIDENTAERYGKEKQVFTCRTVEEHGRVLGRSGSVRMKAHLTGTSARQVTVNADVTCLSF